MPTFEDTVALVYSYIKRKNTLDTQRPQRVAAVLARTGEPHRMLKTLHVAGTKGKGSTCAMLAAALAANGYRVGLYTSPHLHNIRERIQVGGQPIDEETFTRMAFALKQHFDRVPGIGFPEVMTCLALHIFQQRSVDVAVIEAHLGGRYDATNVVQPECCAITTIDYDHTDILGKSLAQIAHQKAGIIKRGVPVVSAPQSAEVVPVLRREADKQSASLAVLGTDVPLDVHAMTPNGQSATVGGENYTTNLLGVHQGTNLAVAITVLNQLTGFVLERERTQHGLLGVQWGGRLEVVREQPPVVLDIAHNVAAARVLRQSLDALYPGVPCTFVFGSKANKDVHGMLRTLVRNDDTLILTRSDDPPTADPAELAAIARAERVQLLHQETSVRDATDKALMLATPGKLVCVTGSIFVVAQAREHLLAR